MYGDEQEEQHRYTTWQSKKKFVTEHNLHADTYGYTLEMNVFSDMERDEINAKHIAGGSLKSGRVVQHHSISG